MVFLFFPYCTYLYIYSTIHLIFLQAFTKKDIKITLSKTIYNIILNKVIFDIIYYNFTPFNKFELLDLEAITSSNCSSLYTGIPIIIDSVSAVKLLQ